MEDNQLYNLKWKNYENHMMTVFDRILSNESFADVTLVCGEPDAEVASSIKAHKILLGACSPYFELVLSEHPNQHTVVILPPDVRPEHLNHVLQFVYRGEVQVPQEQLAGVLRCAGQLRIRGLDSDYSRQREEPPRTPLPGLSRESSTEPDRPASQQSGAGKRKSSPKFHFLKNNRRKPSFPSRRADSPAALQEPATGGGGGAAVGRPLGTPDGSVADESQFTQEQEEEKWERESAGVETDGPVDFTIKSEHSTPPPAPDLGDMAAFLATAAAAVRTAHQENDGSPPLNSVGASPVGPPPPMPVMMPFPPAFPSNKNYTKRDMSLALEALRSKKLSLSRASEIYGIPPTTLWQRANRMGIPTPKKDTANKTWSEDDLNSALEALRKKEISANKAAKVYKIPSSTLYKIARKEGIELAQPFNAVATAWNQEDLNLALEAIKGGMAVQKAAAEYGIPSGTLYGRCKKVGIELSKATQVHWSEEDMISALETVRSGTMSINQAAIHFHLPYSSLYGRINRLKREQAAEWSAFRDYELQEMDTEDISNGIDFSHYLSTSHETEEGVVGGPEGVQPPSDM